MIRPMHVAVTVLGVVAGLGVGVAPVATADPPYATCKDAAKDGRYNIPQNDPAYLSKLDRDGDGIACE